MPFIEIPKPTLNDRVDRPPGAYVTPPTSPQQWWKNPNELGQAVVVVAVLVVVSLLLIRALTATRNCLRRREPAGSQPVQITQPKFDEALWQKAKDIAYRREPPLPLPEYFEIHLALVVTIAIIVFCGLAGIDVERHPAALLITAGISAAIPAAMQYHQQRRYEREHIMQYRQLLAEKATPKKMP